MRPLSRRALLAVGVILPAWPAWAARPGCPPRQVLFVCPAGTVKSAIAREMARRRIAARGLSVQVASRGIMPEDHVSPALAARLAADGIDPRAEPLRALAPADLAQADVVVAFDEAAQAPGLSGALNWSTPSWNTDYDRAKVVVAERVEALLDELAAAPCRR